MLRSMIANNDDKDSKFITNTNNIYYIMIAQIGVYGKEFITYISRKSHFGWLYLLKVYVSDNII